MLGPLLHALPRWGPEAPLLKLDRQHVSKVWARARRAAGLEAEGYVPYQLRHGGPSHDRKEGLRTPMEVKLRGSWSNDRSAKRYEAAARLQAEFAKAPLGAQQAALEAIERSPPVRPAFFIDLLADRTSGLRRRRLA
mmetsp:Transcript_9801/g.30489  ORF Transcript_9801/g.30489 Transcript_9801/m.30489 type:complete len:137 (-) Transcript_9801:194-604(-)